MGCYLVLLLSSTRERGGFSRHWRQAHLQRIAKTMAPDHQRWIVSTSPREDSTSSVLDIQQRTWSAERLFQDAMFADE